MGLCRRPAGNAWNELRAAAGAGAGSTDQAAMVLRERDARVPGKMAGIGLHSIQEAFNLSADLFVSGQAPDCHPDLTRLRLHFRYTQPVLARLRHAPSSVTLPANPGMSAKEAAGDPHRICQSKNHFFPAFVPQGGNSKLTDKKNAGKYVFLCRGDQFSA